MKYLISILFIYSSLLSFSQKINYYNFNSDSLNNAVLRQLNSYRKNNGLDTLVYSKVLHQQITKKHCEEVSYMVYNKFRSTTYHILVDSVLRYTNFKNDIGNESLEKIGGVLSIGSPSLKPRLDFSENIHRSNDDTLTQHVGFNTYDEIAKFAVYRWSISTKGHAEAQLRDYSSQGLPGMFACHTVMTKDNVVYVFVNFVTIHRKSTLQVSH